MICKHCGMDSTTTDVCSWCGQALTAGSDAPTNETDANTLPTADTPSVESDMDAEAAGAPLLNASVSAAPTKKTNRPAPGVPPPGGRKRVPVPARPVPSARAPVSDLSAAPTPLRSPVIAVDAPLPDAPAAQSAYTLNAASSVSADAPSDITLETSPLRAPSETLAAREETGNAIIVTDILATPQEVADAVAESGTVGTAAPVRRHRRQRNTEDGPAPLVLLARYLVVAGFLFIVLEGLAHLLHDRTGLKFSGWAIGPLLVAEFMAAMLLPILKVGPWIEDDSDDLVWFVLLTLMFGPLVSLVCYGFLGAMRRSYNASLLGCMLLAAAARLLLMVNTHQYGLALLTPYANLDQWNFQFMFINWLGFVALAGWGVASFFRGLNE